MAEGFRHDVGQLSLRDFEQLHRTFTTHPDEILRILQALMRRRTPLLRGLNRRIDREKAYLIEVDSNGLSLRTENFEPDPRGSRPWYLNAEHDGIPLFFRVLPIRAGRGGVVRSSLPEAIYRRERRDRTRHRPSELRAPRSVIVSMAGETSEGEVADYSADGLALRVPIRHGAFPSPGLRVRFLDGEWAGTEVNGEIRHAKPVPDRPGWTQIGLYVTRTPASGSIPVERRSVVLEQSSITKLRHRWELLSGAAAVASSRILKGFRTDSAQSFEPDVVHFSNSHGEPIKAIVNSWREESPATVVLIPPAWGKTKETLLPLALTIVESFAAAGKPIVVLRFDGIRKRGESFNDPECRFPGREHLRFTFSQGVRDIHAALDYVHSGNRFNPSRVVLLTFSAASVDGRRAVAEDAGRYLSGWINVVGAPDLQSAMRIVSGGVDFLGGYEKGVRFGLQEVQGVIVDMDYAARDALVNRLAFLEDAKADMSRIEVPVTWIHGRYDAWMDFERVRTLMSTGRRDNRRLIEVPTGHQLRSSREALEVFQLIAREAARISSGEEIAACPPKMVALARASRAERRRLPSPEFDRSRFWRDYLVGRDGNLGIELMTATSAYDELMKVQIDELKLSDGCRVVDLGSGTGAFPLQLFATDEVQPAEILEVDYIKPALERAQRRIKERFPARANSVSYLICDLDGCDAASRIPLANSCADAALASLLLSYLKEPDVLLREAFRILRPGGRLVLSALRPDADTSRIYSAGAAELKAGKARSIFGSEVEETLQDSLRSFLNDAARLLDLEESGVFRFWEQRDLVRRVRQAGFRGVRVRQSFGDPPQAFVVSARRP